ncbi:MAG: hypothetical protein Kow002_15960 [Anaerolineales bacterium]
MQRLLFFSILMIAALALSACGGETQVPTDAPAVPTDTLVPTIAPTETPASPLAILVLPQEMDQESYDLYQAVVYDLAQQAGMRFQVRNTLHEADLEPALKIVIIFPPQPEGSLAALAAAAPQTQFLAINIPDVIPGGNISVLAENTQQDVVAFMAGYIGALVTEDYRIGMIYPQNDPEALQAVSAFTNGMRYYCGECQGFYYLPYTFPQTIEIPSDEDPSRYSAYAEYLISQRQVDYIYVHPDLATPDFLTYVGNAGAPQVGATALDQKPLYWVASLRPDVVGAIQAAWPMLLAGQGGQAIQSPLTLTDVDPTLLSPGKQALADQVLADVLAGQISIYNVP